MVQELFIAMIVVALKILSAIVLSATALYSGMGMLDRLTQGIDEWKEVKKGNAAIGILFVSVMVSLVLLVEPMISDFVQSIRADLPLLLTAILLLFTFVNYLLALLAGTIVIFLIIHVIDRITMDIEEFKELKKGNVAVALIFAFAILLVALAVRAPFESAFNGLKLLESSLL